MMESLLRDVRNAVRSLSKSRGFVAVAVTSLALALGLNTTTFAVLDAFMHPYVPYRDAEHVVRVWSQGDPRQERVSWAERDALLLERLAHFSDSIAFTRIRLANVSDGKTEEEMYFQDVSPNYFRVVGLQPEIGRTFETSTAENLVVVGHRFWQANLGAPRSLEGVFVTIDGVSHAVVGVIPADPNQSFLTAVWRMRPAKEFGAGGGMGQPLARLRSGVELEDVRADLARLAKTLEA
ncbi:MAG: ABC transporter permease, partial [Gemmatimonadetes bacterium]|nr:ABC transporter permease [Gemmatimonadota bacterium]